MGSRTVGFAVLINCIFTALGLGVATEPTFITGDRSMRLMNSYTGLVAPLALAGLVTMPLALAA